MLIIGYRRNQKAQNKLNGQEKGFINLTVEK